LTDPDSVPPRLLGATFVLLLRALESSADARDLLEGRTEARELLGDAAPDPI
jgi:hypothetical protein